MRVNHSGRRNPPHAFQCAWQVRWTADYSTITYQRLTFDSMSGGSSYNTSGGLDITSGLFTVAPGFAGIWTITYTIQSDQHSGEGNEAEWSL